MGTNFALSLSFEGIKLLHRVDGGWRIIGRTEIDNDQLDDALADLLDKALKLEPVGFCTKLIIPMDQIKYLTIDSTQTTEQDVHDALEGTTPYSLDELVIDFERSGGRTHIAAVARETLDEAEAFAKGHGFNPVSFVAVPDPFTFQSEIFFGPTRCMTDVLGIDGAVERDTLPVMVVGTRLKSRLLMFNTGEDAAVGDEGFDLADLLAPYASEEAHAPKPEPETTAVDRTQVQDALFDQVGSEPEADDPPAPAPQPQKVTAKQPAAPRAILGTGPFAKVGIDRVIPEYDMPDPIAERTPVATKEQKPAIADAFRNAENIVHFTPAMPKVPMVPSQPVLAKLDYYDTVIAEVHKVAPTPLRRRRLQSVTALSSATPAEIAAFPPVGSAPAVPPRQISPEKTPVLANRTAWIGIGLAATIAAAGVLAWSQMGADDSTAASDTVPLSIQDDAQSANVTLVPQSEAAATTLDSAPVVSDSTPGQIEPPEIAATGPAVTSLGTVADSPARQNAAPTLSPVAEADALPTAPQPAPPEPKRPDSQDVAETAPPTQATPGIVLTPDEAARAYQATGVWQRAPRIDDAPPQAELGEILWTPSPPAPARIAQPALPDLAPAAADDLLQTPANPPAPTTEFALDDNGNIQATPEGAVTPEGAIVFAGLPDLQVRARPELSPTDIAAMSALAPAPEGVVIIAGPPPVVPPLRPLRDPVAASLQDAITDPVGQPEDAATPGAVGIAALRPEARPDTQTSTVTVASADTAAVRPQLRPAGASVTADADLPTTPDITSVLVALQEEQATTPFIDMTPRAVATSDRPEARPQNFARVVANAVARQAAANQQAAAAAPAAAPAPTQRINVPVPQNTRPAPGGVARAATQEDAIRLRDMNLIGVYGRPNDRRALVRLSNGRYVRVQIGSSLDGGQVTAIGDQALNYVKRGRTYALEMPNG